MTQEDLLTYCLAKPGAWRDEPWEGEGRDRESADEWLHRYPHDATVSAYIGRYGWNVLRLRGGIPEDELYAAIDESYDSVVAALPRSLRPDSPPPGPGGPPIHPPRPARPGR